MNNDIGLNAQDFQAAVDQFSKTVEALFELEMMKAANNARGEGDPPAYSADDFALYKQHYFNKD